MRGFNTSWSCWGLRPSSCAIRFDAMSEENDCSLQMLLKFVPQDRHEEFKTYVHEIVEDPHYAGTIDGTFLGFICDYINYAKLIERRLSTHNHPLGGGPERPPLTVYDVGCAMGFQHVVFDERIHYVGIDMGTQPEPKFFRKNCTFVRGRFSTIVDQLKIRRDCAIGIANMSLFYTCTDDLPIFDRTFGRKFVF